MNYLSYKYFSGNGDPWFCLKCNSQLFSFGTLKNKPFIQLIRDKNNIKNTNENESNSLVLNPPSLSLLFNHFNNISQTHHHKDPETIVRCKDLI